MENERLRITLDHTDKIYFAGQTVNGEIWLNLAKRTKIRAIKAQITGKGKCKWMEILRKNSQNNETTRSLFYSSKEIYAHNDYVLPMFEPRGLELNPGEHTFQFSLPLDTNLPSSFKGSYGSIKYKLRLLIQRPWTFDEKHMIPLTIVKNWPLPAAYRVFPNSLEKQITKTISLFGNRPITMLAQLPKDFGVRGEPISICVTVSNNSNTHVEKLRFTLLQNIWYYSHVPLRIQKMECITIANKETGSVHKKSERSFAHELLIPVNTQPSDDELSGVINISYELRVEAVLRGFFKNLILNLPFQLYSGDSEAVLNGSIDQSPPRPPASYIRQSAGVVGGGSGAGNPFESSRPLSVYPSLDSSIGSPSHSSQYSECSSINSTTSDSSAATLSPAVVGSGGGAAAESSYASASSSQYNSPSARASLHSSNVPYMPYSSSPLMVNSYPPATHLPPYPLPESPQYSLLSQSRATPPPAIATTSTAATSFSSSSFTFGRLPPGAQELPPSYEELFGNATAPPQWAK